MYKRTAVLLSIIIISLLPIAAFNTLAFEATPAPPTTVNAAPPTGAGIAVSRNDTNLINTDYLMVYGPDICTAWGDPFSPISPTWSATSWANPQDYLGVYTYPFRIRIPPDYPDNIVRVELFDPDSINQAENSASVIHSRVAQEAGFPPTPQVMFCSNTQKDSCAIQTGESTLVGSNGITYDHINPFWFMRVDDNRGNGSNACQNYQGYSPETNTQTRFTLSYYEPTVNNTFNQVILGSYTGQVGDGVRDSGDHDTDLRWVSPGGALSMDQATFVPADQGSFEVNLDEVGANLSIDPLTGEKLLYLDITSLSGGSKNGFAIWAGPDDYILVTPSYVNWRNLRNLNDPGAHYAQGIKVEAVENLPRETLIADRLNFPLAELGPEYGGQTITVTLFDLDAGSKPPIMFFMDSLAFTPDDSATDGIDPALTDWGVSFGGDIDPLDRCFSGGSAYGTQCNNTWINPVYTITLPSERQCDYANPTPETCTPFYGGQLQTRFQGGSGDSHAWHIEFPERPLLDDSAGCSAFPIGTQWNNRSVLPPDQTGANAWPEDFDYPSPAPNYNQYYNHVPNRPLEEARPGYLYVIADSPSSFAPAFLAWNVCSTDSDDLANSLTWPGNAKDYTPGLETCPANGLPVFPGFMERGDPSDLEMHTRDWLSVSTGSLTSSSVQDALEDHIDLDRVLRLLVWDEMDGSGSNPGVLIKRFALFRLVGYGLDQGIGSDFIMVEFVGWNDSCSQRATPLGTVTLDGPTNGLIHTNYPFTATVSPINVTPPITIVWSATGSAPFTQTNTLAVCRRSQILLTKAIFV